MSVNANRAAMGASVWENGSTIGSITAANGRTAVLFGTDRDGVPVLRLNDPATGITAFELTVLPDGSAEIYAPRGLTIVEEPRGRDIDRLAPPDDETEIETEDDTGG